MRLPAAARPAMFAWARVFRPMLVAHVALIVATVFCVSGAEAGGRGGGNKRQPSKPADNSQLVSELRGQIAAAKMTLSEAEAKITAAKNEMEEAKKKNTEGQSSVGDAEKETHSAAQKLHEIETQLLESQGPDTKLSKTKVQLDAARKAIDKYRDDNGIAAGAVVDDPEFQTLKDNLKETSHEYEKLKTALFEGSAEWTAASEAAKAARDKGADAKEQAGAGTSGNARKDLKKAQKEAAAAHLVINTATSKLISMGVPVDPPTKKKGK
jgi:chromosome segregation ATPase